MSKMKIHTSTLGDIKAFVFITAVLMIVKYYTSLSILSIILYIIGYAVISVVMFLIGPSYFIVVLLTSF